MSNVDDSTAKPIATLLPLPESGLHAVETILRSIGEDPARDGLLDTPSRVVKSWKDLFGGYQIDAQEILSRTFESEDYDQMIVLRDIEFFSTCEHHMLPFFGKAHVAYIPSAETKRVVGISKLARVVDCFSRRLQIQERLTNQIADAINEALKPRGVIVVLEAKHFCMVARGVGKQNSIMTTSSVRGAFSNEASKAREEFLGLCRKG